MSRIKNDTVAALADMFGEIIPGEGTGFGAFTCTEANALAEMFTVFGHVDAATNVILGHSYTDDGGDDHGYIAALADHSDGDTAADYEAANVFVRRRFLGEATAQPCDHEAKAAQLAAARKEAETLTGRIGQLRQELGETLADIDSVPV
jgi:hypothetical protein